MNKILLALVFVIVFCSVVFAVTDDVNFDSLVSFDGFFEEVREFFTDVLREGWLLFLSLFFVWFAYDRLKRIADDRFEKHIADLDQQVRIMGIASKEEEKKEEFECGSMPVREHTAARRMEQSRSESLDGNEGEDEDQEHEHHRGRFRDGY